VRTVVDMLDMGGREMQAARDQRTQTYTHSHTTSSSEGRIKQEHAFDEGNRDDPHSSIRGVLFYGMEWKGRGRGGTQRLGGRWEETLTVQSMSGSPPSLVAANHKTASM